MHTPLPMDKSSRQRYKIKASLPSVGHDSRRKPNPIGSQAAGLTIGSSSTPRRRAQTQVVTYPLEPHPDAAERCVDCQSVAWLDASTGKTGYHYTP